MLLQHAQKEYELMINSDKRTIKLQIPEGREIVCHNSWDYKSNFNENSLKTQTHITYEHPLLKVIKMDLLPVTTTPVWLVTVLRKEESNLKNK